MTINSVAIVTGASQGIGRAAAVRLARDFTAVVLTARSEDKLQTTATAVAAAGAEPLVYPLDLREAASADILVKGTLDRFGRIDALLNIAGAVPQIDVFQMTDAQWDDGNGAEATRRSSPDDTGLGGIEGLARLSCTNLGKCGPRPQAWVCRGRRDERSHHRAR